ncbi:unnamed protein product [Menidia menidia]|uniref:(Atlantic silverside) hypothetical protein n=1 Tax=Menidia menidia TaxID=238744 RepID=A0A8S4AW97_9TELE|nr:unnamed protein product [Menidia menidia]
MWVIANPWPPAAAQEQKASEILGARLSGRALQHLGSPVDLLEQDVAAGGIGHSAVSKHGAWRGSTWGQLLNISEERVGKMSVFRFSVVLFSTFIVTLANKDSVVSCRLRENCVLPCSFPPGDDTVIHWMQVSSNKLQVHSYYHNMDQLERQDKLFKDRTSMSSDEISRGTASLKLKRVTFEDQGRYQCYTSTIEGSTDSFIVLNVDVLIQKVDIDRRKDRITCSSEDIYPKPELTWTTNPPSSPQHTLSLSETEDKLYNISSSLIVSRNTSDLDYTCTVRTRGNKKSTTLFKTDNVSVSGSETTIPCKAPTATVQKIVWTFDHHEIILNRSRAEDSYRCSEKWERHVEKVTDTGLTLKDLSSSQEGLYTCEISSDEETYIKITYLEISKAKHIIIIGSVISAVLGVIVLSIGVVCLVKRSRKGGVI